MKRFLTPLLSTLLVFAPVFAAEKSDDEVNARKVALDLAGAFSNDGFKLRDGHWTGSVASGKGAVIQVNLFAGNEYWFSLGATTKAKKVLVSVFDETGKPIEYEPYQEGASAAAGFAPDASGPYLIKVEELEGEPSVFCLLYSYK
jgi:hypothetical protein